MIEVHGVRPTPRELRAVFKAWPSLRYWSSAPLIWILICMIVTVALTHGGLWVALAQLALLYGAIGLGFLAQRVLMRVRERAPAAAMAGDWRVDEFGVRIVSPLDEWFTDWRGIMRVVEEKDRFIFAVTPTSNPVLPTRLLTPEQKTELRALIAEVTASGRLGSGV